MRDGAQLSLFALCAPPEADAGMCAIGVPAPVLEAERWLEAHRTADDEALLAECEEALATEQNRAHEGWSLWRYPGTDSCCVVLVLSDQCLAVRRDGDVYVVEVYGWYCRRRPLLQDAIEAVQVHWPSTRLPFSDLWTPGEVAEREPECDLWSGRRRGAMQEAGDA